MNKHKPIRKAVFPVAGRGTRFLPATKAIPKEMMPIIDRPLIQYAVEEAYEAGIRHMVFVTGRTKRSVEDHFDTAYELENELEQAGKTELLQIARSISPDDMVCSYVRQPRALGLGHAVLCAEHLVGREPFAVLLADDLMVGQPSITAQMVQQQAQAAGNTQSSRMQALAAANAAMQVAQGAAQTQAALARGDTTGGLGISLSVGQSSIWNV